MNKSGAPNVQVDVKLMNLPTNAAGYAISSHTSCDNVETLGTRLYDRSISGTTLEESTEWDTSGSGFSDGANRPVYLYDSDNAVICCTMTGSALASFQGAYPGYTGDLTPSGYVVVGQNPGNCDSIVHTIFYSLRGLEVSGSGGGLHIHSGTSCATAGEVGGHYWTPTNDTDPWTNAYVVFVCILLLTQLIDSRSNTGTVQHTMQLTRVVM